MPEIKGIKKAILIFENPDSKESHRVIFGETLQLMELLINQFPIIWKRLQLMAGKSLSPKEMMKFYKTIKEDWTKTHGVKFAEDMEMELSYKIKKLK